MVRKTLAPAKSSGKPISILVPGEHRLEGLVDQHGIDIRMVEPLRKAMADRFLEAIVAQDGRVDEASERRLGRHRCLRLLADLRPNRVVCADLALGRGSRPGCHLTTPEP